jgi:hypothetical protein
MPPDTLPDHHFLLIAPNLGSEWLFDAARSYWETFQPTVISNVELLRLLPPERTITVTLLSRRDLLKSLQAQLAEVVPEAFIDPIVYDYFDDAKLTLEGRTQLNQPFGVPLAPTPTPTASPPPTPTPGATPIPTRPPGGFITRTPTVSPDNGDS